MKQSTIDGINAALDRLTARRDALMAETEEE
jgi:hypothetical protein